MLDDSDKKLLNLLQKGMEMVERPFCSLGEKTGLAESEVVKRLCRLKESGYIRRIGGVLDSSALGLRTTLIAMEVEEESFYRVAEKAAGFDEVTHCYRRSGDLNLWFTLVFRDDAEKKKLLKQIYGAGTVKKVFDLPNEKKYKLRVFFDLEK